MHEPSAHFRSMLHIETRGQLLTKKLKPQHLGFEGSGFGDSLGTLKPKPLRQKGAVQV